jgi:nanoRNase/pAp phosphatase (c-di-AMP/oligoRNAs hydrolase)
MLMGDSFFESLFQDNEVLRIEFDHHLEADSEYSGDEKYRLVMDASSTCELIGLVAFKLEKREDILRRYQIDNVFTRNFVLAVLTGIIGDSKMGKYLKSNREKWFYKLFSNKFEDMLAQITYKGSSNFSNMEEVYNELVMLSDNEEQCYRSMVQHKMKSAFLAYIVLHKQESDTIMTRFDQETIVSIARTLADRLAEESGYVSLVCYYDNPEDTDYIQFRMRRSHRFKGLDLRTILLKFGIENGGGHQGAIGFRVKRHTVPDIDEYVKNIILGTEELIAAVSS